MAPQHDEESCIVCRFLAVKSLSPTLTAISCCFECIEWTEPGDSSGGPFIRVSTPLSRGPPRV